MSDEVTDRAIAALHDAFDGNQPAALRSTRTIAALDYLGRALDGHWSAQQFRIAIAIDNAAARWRNVNASLNAIELARLGNRA